MNSILGKLLLYIQVKQKILLIVMKKIIEVYMAKVNSIYSKRLLFLVNSISIEHNAIS